MSNTKKLTVCVGVSNSGKSTWARKQATTVIERDEIRAFLFPGYEVQAPDSKKEQIVSQEQERQILSAIKAEKHHIIISDTNLNPKYVERLVSLFEPYDYEVTYEYFDDSLDYELCLQRNASRERKVPDDVICKQWKSYQLLRNQHNNYRFDTKEKPVLFVSDVHGLYAKLSSICSKYGTTHNIILSGDLNDQRFDILEDNFREGVSSLDCLLFARRFADFNVHLLHSNHQKNLVNLLSGKRKKLSYGLQNTAAELTWMGLVLGFDNEKCTNEELWLKHSWVETDELRDLANFLDTRPSCYAMTHNGQEWRFAHAYVPDTQEDFCPFPNKEGLYIYGPHRPENSNERLQWWLEREREAVKFKACCGHSHQVFHGKNSIICDPDDDSTLGLVFFEDCQEPRMEFV